MSGGRGRHTDTPSHSFRPRTTNPMNNRNPNSPWNPATPVKVTPEEYEKQVVEWLNSVGRGLHSFRVEHLQRRSGHGGEYTFDAVAELTILEGARIVILVECKRYSRPVEREKLLALNTKMQEVGANKAMMFATCGFQSGALEFAKAHGIATVVFASGSYVYETKGLEPLAFRRPSGSSPAFSGVFVVLENSRYLCRTIVSDGSNPLRVWLNSH